MDMKGGKKEKEILNRKETNEVEKKHNETEMKQSKYINETEVKW